MIFMIIYTLSLFVLMYNAAIWLGMFVKDGNWLKQLAATVALLFFAIMGTVFLLALATMAPVLTYVDIIATIVLAVCALISMAVTAVEVQKRYGTKTAVYGPSQKFINFTSEKYSKLKELRDKRRSQRAINKNQAQAV